MSLSLSSLLNPSPDADPQQPQHASSSSPTLDRKNSLPPIQYVQSPVHDATSPHSAQFPPSGHSYHPPVENDALNALAAMSSSTAPLPSQSQWYTGDGQGYDRRGSAVERPGSSGMQLPPPPSPTAMMDRKMSSPTLEQYHVASRSPQQRRQSLLSPIQSHVVLPPIRAGDQPGQPSSVQEHVLVNAPTFTSPDTHRVSSDLNHAPLPPNPYTAETTSSPSQIKQEAVNTPRASSPVSAQQTPMKHTEGGMESVKAIATLKNEHGLRTQSPLRESSVPIQSTEVPTPEPAIPKKRPAPSKTKKGTATMKKSNPNKKRKVEPKRSVTPSSRASKPPTFKTASSKGTPANSSPVAPSTRSQSASVDEDAYDDDDDEGPAGSDDELYCICRKPDNGTFMIGCDGTCDDWFHGKCVGIEESKKHLIDKYICPRCTKGGVGETTWKRMCRRSGCRQAAKIGKTKNGKEGSKYCSDECGVLFFREMVAKSRGKEEMAKHRSSRRKNSFVSNERPYQNQDDDLGARGGVLAAGELKALVDTSKTADDFKKLGEGVLSPPSTPDSKSSPSTKKSTNADFNDSESKAFESITRQKDEARRKHTLLKDRMKFVQMAKQAASRVATERELKPKEYCGYDSRIEWTEEQFALWRSSKPGQQAFELETLSVETSSTAQEENKALPTSADEEVEVMLRGVEVCERKKCARHLEWPKLAIDDVRFEMGDNGDRMRGLDREEREVRERAALRGKRGVDGGREGRVEVHGLGIGVDIGGGEGMEVDG